MTRCSGETFPEERFHEVPCVLPTAAMWRIRSWRGDHFIDAFSRQERFRIDDAAKNHGVRIEDIFEAEGRL